MKLKVQHVFDATLVVASIIRANRPMPNKASYRLARLHAKLQPEFATIAARRDAMITAYDYHASTGGADGVPVQVSDQFSVPFDKTAEFSAAWAEIGNEEIEVGVEAVPLDLFGDEATITSQEFIALGDLVRE